ncbi:MAG: response regulator [Deltaproteobacteria bacterium]|nr:MAG: response regulator [Deltaproteobacteria bacterium]
MAKKVLIVDDEPEAIDFASAVLEENGYLAISAEDGIEGMEKVRAEKPDLVLLDIMMPGKGGIAMYGDLRKDEETKDIPVIIITGVARGQRFEESMMRKDPRIPLPDGYIEKPMKPEGLLRLVEKLLK